jgi:hypothetical protein
MRARAARVVQVVLVLRRSGRRLEQRRTDDAEGGGRLDHVFFRDLAFLGAQEDRGVFLQLRKELRFPDLAVRLLFRRLLLGHMRVS